MKVIIMGVLAFLMVFRWALRAWPWDSSVRATDANIRQVYVHLLIFYILMLTTSVGLIFGLEMFA